MIFFLFIGCASSVNALPLAGRIASELSQFFPPSVFSRFFNDPVVIDTFKASFNDTRRIARRHYEVSNCLDGEIVKIISPYITVYKEPDQRGEFLGEFIVGEYICILNESVMWAETNFGWVLKDWETSIFGWEKL